MVRDNEGELILRKDQYVTIAGDKILSVSGEPPEEGVHVVETDGTIMPGLIDLHDHLRYAYSRRFAESIFAEERARFANRYEWQLRETYLDFKEHHKHHMPRDNPEAQVAFELYGEMRELVGGTTSVADQVSEEAQKALARNVYGSKDVNGLGQNLAYEVYAIDPSGLQDSPPRFEMKASFLERVQDADVVYLHLAEGTKGDAITRGEFEAFMTWAEANPELAKKIVPIHVTGLESEDFRRLRDVGIDSAIWSPYSNMVLYGETMDVAAAQKQGFKIALGTDWYPSGSDSQFDELRYAQRLVARGVVPGVTEQQLVDMILKNPADILGAPEVGQIAPGYQADLIVVPKGDSPMETAMGADVNTMGMVMVAGQPYYGRTELMEQVVDAPTPAPQRPEGWSFSFNYRPIQEFVTNALKKTGQMILPLESLKESVPVVSPV